MDKKVDALEQREESITKKQKETQKVHEDVQELYKKQVAELERLSGLSSEEAKQLLLSDIEKEIKHEAAMMIKDIESKAKEEGERKAKEIVSL
ncbi:MAG: rny, partial [Clostridia bacterium]|nr:rny [Clostridia bacterium]